MAETLLMMLLFGLVVDQGLTVFSFQRKGEADRSSAASSYLSAEMKGWLLSPLLIILEFRACISRCLSFKEVSFLRGKKWCKSQGIQRWKRAIHIRNALDSSICAWVRWRSHLFQPLPWAHPHGSCVGYRHLCQAELPRICCRAAPVYLWSWCGLVEKTPGQNSDDMVYSSGPVTDQLTGLLIPKWDPH